MGTIITIAVAIAVTVVLSGVEALVMPGAIAGGYSMTTMRVITLSMISSRCTSVSSTMSCSTALIAVRIIGQLLVLLPEDTKAGRW